LGLILRRFMDLRKSREQKFYEYFVTLQKEYIVAELRTKIYVDDVGRKKSEEIMQGKKKKVFDIAFKNRIKTIFEDMKVGSISLYDEELKKKLYNEIYGHGYPNFIYRDEKQRQILSMRDKRSYYSKNNNFMFEDKICILIDVDFVTEYCILTCNNEKFVCKLSEIKRIF
jgi:hypothetical protein